MMRVTIFACLFVTFAGAEYKWSGTDWQWVAEDSDSDKPQVNTNSDISRVAEGSGDDYDNFEDDEDYDDDEYDDDYNFDSYDNNNNNKNNNNNQFGNPSMGSSDDEDFVEGSGGSSIDTGYPPYGKEDRNQPTGFEDYNESEKEKDTYVDKPSHTFDFNQPDHSDSYHESEKDKEIYVDKPSNTFDFNQPHHSDSDISFVGSSDTDERIPYVEVTSEPKVPAPTTTSTTTERQPDWATGDHQEVHKKGPTSNRPASFFAQPGILAAVIGGAVVGLLCAILLVMFIVYRMRKKDEGSYALDEPKRAHNVNSYAKPPSREFYA